jgi:hypothetical protein
MTGRYTVTIPSLGGVQSGETAVDNDSEASEASKGRAMITAKDIARMGLDKRPLTPTEQAQLDAEIAANERATASPISQYADVDDDDDSE